MATYHINADSGNDTTGDGSENLPWLTISKAYTSSTTADTINIQDSIATYLFGTQTISNRVLTGETAGSRTTGGQGSVLDGASTSFKWTVGGTCTWSDVIFQDYDNSSNAQFGPFDSVDGVTLTATNCIFRDFIIGSTNTDFFMFGSRSSIAQTLSFTACALSDIRTAVAAAASNLFRIGAGAGDTGTVTLNSCVLFTDTTTSTDFPAIFYNTGSGTRNLAIKNSIFREAGTGSISITAGSTPSSYAITNSCNNNITVNGSPTESGNITTDPLFVDEDNGNFNLRPTSPCIDTGILI